jgi:hypothetical protein
MNVRIVLSLADDCFSDIELESVHKVFLGSYILCTIRRLFVFTYNVSSCAILRLQIYLQFYLFEERDFDFNLHPLPANKQRLSDITVKCKAFALKMTVLTTYGFSVIY